MCAVLVLDRTSQARKPFTFCGSIWGDGTHGPVLLSFAEGGISQNLASRINQTHKGQVYVIINKSCSHMMTGESLADMYDSLFTDAFKIKRSQLGVGPSHKGLLMCDAFTGGHAVCNGLDERRTRWASANGILLPRQMPGGWSAKGQPCDQIFGFFKQRVQVRMDVQMGFGPTFFHSQSYERLPVGPTGALCVLHATGPHNHEVRCMPSLGRFIRS